LANVDPAINPTDAAAIIAQKILVLSTPFPVLS